MCHVFPDNRSLSEPLLSLLLRVIDSPEALQEFTALGALEVVCENLVKANRGMVNCQPSTVSIVMQHLSQAPFFAVKHNIKTQLTRTSTSKVSPDSVSGMLINFAPLGEYFARLFQKQRWRIRPILWIVLCRPPVTSHSYVYVVLTYILIYLFLY